MSGAADLYAYRPGATVGVHVVADANGNVATRGYGVTPVDENAEATEVALVDTAGTGLAFLARDPVGYDPDATYTAGEVVGETEIAMWKPLALLTPDAGYTASVGDLVEFTGGGSVVASSDGTNPYGRVFRTIREPAAPEKVAVAIQR